MTITFYPKALLITAVFVVMFGATVLLAIDVGRGIAATGILAVLAYVLVEFLSTFGALLDHFTHLAALLEGSAVVPPGLSR